MLDICVVWTFTGMES